MRFQENIQQRFTARHRKSLDFVGSVNDKVILDIGCSFGWFEKFTIENGSKEVVGIDLDEKNLLSASSQINHELASFLKGSVLDLSILLENHFDIVVMWEVLEHLSGNIERKAFGEIKRVLKPAGILCISVPNKNFWSCMLDPAWYFGHKHYSRNHIVDILSKAGFKTEKIEYGGGFYELFSMFLLYIFKWFFRSEIPFKNWFEIKREKEYFNDRGFVNLYVRGRKLPLPG